MKVLAVIPARYASTRFPGKPLVKIGGKSMIRRVYEQALLCEHIDEVVVATDDERIRAEVESFDGQVAMTRSDHPSGTDRVAEVAINRSEADIVINIQGDEPFLDPRQLDGLIDLFSNPEVEIVTLARPIRSQDDLFDPNVVKALFDESQRAIYFSRHPLPYVRSKPKEEWLSEEVHFQHIGLYAFRREVLKAVTQLPTGRLERLESLEQLRWLEAGFRIFVGKTDLPSLGIDTPEDLQKAEAWLKGQSD